MTRKERIKENNKIFKNFMEKIRNMSNNIKKTDIKKHRHINRDENTQDDNSNEENYHFKHGKPGELFKEKINQRKEIEKQQIEKGIKINKPWEKKYDTEKKEPSVQDNSSRKIKKQTIEKIEQNENIKSFKNKYNNFIKNKVKKNIK